MYMYMRKQCFGMIALAFLNCFFYVLVHYTHYSIRLCMVLPLWRDTEIKLDGDG